MKYYAGLDISLEETTICIVDDAGSITRELRALSDPESLISAFDALGLPLERIGLEACSQSPRAEVGWLAGIVHRNALGESGNGCDAEQDRPQ